MKRTRSICRKRRIFVLPALALMITGVFVGCSLWDNPVDTTTNKTTTGLSLSAPAIQSVTHDVNLIAGRTMDIGVVSCWIVDNTLFVNYTAEGGWSHSKAAI